jgi:hypothetical protein
MNLSRTELLNKLRGIDEYEFEELVADVWSERGWDTRVTTGSNDREIDVIAEKHSPFHQKQLIQAKRYSTDNNIGSPDIQQYSSLRQQESDVDAIVVVTTSSFSKQAQRTADDLNVKLINGEGFADLISDIGTINFKSRINSLTAETESTNTTNNLKNVFQTQNTQSEKNRRRLKKELNEQTNNRSNWDTDSKRCDTNTTASEIVCPNCKKKIKRTGWFAYVSHFESCGVPSTKPSGMTDKLWTKIVDKIIERGSNSIESADKAKINCKFGDAEEQYREALGYLEQAKEVCDSSTDDHQNVVDKIQYVRKNIELTSDLTGKRPTLTETLTKAERSFQEGVAGYVDGDQTVAKIRFRQARDEFENACQIIENSDDFLLNQPIDVTIEPQLSPPVNTIAKFTRVTDATVEMLSSMSIEAVEDLQVDDDGLQPSVIETFESRGAVTEEESTLLTILSWWDEGGSTEFGTATKIDCRFERSKYGFDKSK